jgi:amino acid transporter
VAVASSANTGRHYYRVLSRYDYAMASMGGVIGSGWLFGALYSAQEAGPGAIWSWLIGGILMLIIALPWAEMGGVVTEAGSVARIPMMTHGALVGFLASWAIAVGAIFAAPVEATAVVQYAGGYIHGLYNGTQLTGLGLFITALMVILFFVINYYGVRWLRNTNTWVTTIKWIVPTLAMIVVNIAGFIHGGGANLTTAPGGFMPDGWHGVLAAISVGGIVYAYSGFRQSLDLSAEGKNPQRDVPVALISVVLFSIALYTLLQLAFLVAVPHAALAKGWAALNYSSPLAQLAGGLGLGWLSVILYADGAWSPAGSGNLFTGTASRLLYAARKNGFYVRGWDKLSHRGIPITTQIIILVAGIIAIAPFPSWHYLVELTTSMGLITYAVGGPSLPVLRRLTDQAGRKRLFDMGPTLAAITAPLTFGIGGLLFYWFGWPTTLQADGIMLVGLIIYAIYHGLYKFSAKDITAGIWFVVWMAFILVMSYLGSFGTGNLHKIAFPLDSLIVLVGCIIIHYWGAASGYETQAWKDYAAGKNLDLVGGEAGAQEAANR